MVVSSPSRDNAISYGCDSSATHLLRCSTMSFFFITFSNPSHFYFYHISITSQEASHKTCEVWLRKSVPIQSKLMFPFIPNPKYDSIGTIGC